MRARLFTGSIYVCGFVVAADERNNTRIIKAIHSSFLFRAVDCFIERFAAINSLVRHSSPINPSWLLALLLDMVA